MTNESQLHLTRMDNDSSRVLSRARSSLIALGLRDAALLAEPDRTDWPTETDPDFQFDYAADAHNSLGVAYYFDQGVPQDYGEAARWFRKAAEQQNPASKHWLGLMYAHGKGVSQDLVEAHKWLSIAADSRNEEYRELSSDTRDTVAMQLNPQLANARRMSVDEIAAKMNPTQTADAKTCP